MARPTFSPRASIHGRSLMSKSIDSTALGDQVVVAADISNGTIISPKFAASAVGPTAIASNAVEAAKIASAAVIGPKIGSAAVGISAAATVLKRHLSTVSLGQVASGGIKNKLVFVAPPSGATILAAKTNAGTLMYHAAGEADTWIFQLRNQSKAANLVKNNASLSGVTLTLTGFKSFPVNNGNSTLLANAGLYVQLSVSGTAQTMVNCSVHLEWSPLNNA